MRIIMANQAELAKQLTDATTAVGKIGDGVTKIGTETKTLIQKVADLTAALANQQNVTPELQAAADALTAQVTVVDDTVKATDDLVPDGAP
jgi:uncharacterized phage infection (PIP) family protein YhgE